MKMMDQEYLKSILDYQPDSGKFTWKSYRPGISIGEAGGINSFGYRKITIDGKNYAAHRLAWLYVYGNFPELQLDHINRIKHDNRICNLRQATSAMNMQNRKMKTGESGLAGASFAVRQRKWVSKITVNGKQIHLGYFITKEEAHYAYLEAASKHHICNINVVKNDQTSIG